MLTIIWESFLRLEKDISKSIDYFKDAIKQKNDPVAMFNLAHTYFFEDEVKQSLLKSIKLLIGSVKEDIPHSFDLLCLVVANKFAPLNEKEIEKEFEDIDKSSGESIARRVFHEIKDNGLNKARVYQQLKDINLVYYINGVDVLSLK